MVRDRFIRGASGALLSLPLLGEAAQGDLGSLSAQATPEPLVTPNGKFFEYSQMRMPTKAATRAAGGAIEIDGLVDRPSRISYDDLAHLPRVKRLLTLECYVNWAGGPLIFTTQFAGVPLAQLFQDAGVKEEARSVEIETFDGHPTFQLPLTELQRPGTMLVAELGGIPVPVRHGGPYTRLMIPGAGGNHLPKWVKRIAFSDKKAPAHDAPPMAGFLSPAPPEARGSISGITITGYAFSAPEPVAAIELSTDGGATYQPLPQLPQPDPNVWITWNVRFVPPRKGFYVLRVRATSARRRKQEVPGTIAIEAA